MTVLADPPRPTVVAALNRTPTAVARPPARFGIIPHGCAPAPVTVVTQGPQGAKGDKGDTGAAGVGSIGDVATVEYLVTSPGEQFVTLPKIPVSAYLLLTINGLRQSRAAYSASGSVLHLPADLNLMTGDVVTLDFA